jgi:putative FmdB family regulatory protein
MPIYEYACRRCRHVFETLVQDGETVECPQCHTAELERLLSLPGRPVTEPAAAACQADPSLPRCGPMCRRP